jgi:hypothetical protein
MQSCLPIKYSGASRNDHQHWTLIYIYTLFCLNLTMTGLVISLELLFVAFTDAVSIPSTRNNNTSDSTQSGWSRQDVLTLIGICIAVVGVLAAVLVSSPGLRERLCMPFECKRNPHPAIRTTVPATTLAYASFQRRHSSHAIPLMQADMLTKFVRSQ